MFADILSPRRLWNFCCKYAKIKGNETISTNFDDLTVQNDFLFKKVMQNKRICKRLIEEILDTKLAAVSTVETDKTVSKFYDRKGIILDVTVADENNTHYNLEMQVRNEKSNLTGEPLLPKRVRYYQSMLDANLLEKGQSYDQLSPTYIIFICPFDLFGEGRYVYTFRKLCMENKDLELNDHTAIIFLNAAGTHGKITARAKNFLQYVKNHLITDDFTSEIDNEVSKIKQNQKVRREYMLYEIRMQEAHNDGFKQGLERGRQEGFDKGLLKVAANMKKLGQFSDEAIALATGLSLARVKAISL